MAEGTIAMIATSLLATGVAANEGHQGRKLARGQAEQQKVKQDALLKKQEQANAAEAQNETDTRQRAVAQSKKRLVTGLLAGKTGTSKTGSLGLHNPSSPASKKLIGTV